MKLSGTPAFSQATVAQAGIPVQFGYSDQLLESRTRTLPEGDVLTLGAGKKLIIPKKVEDPQIKIYKEMKDEIGHGVQFTTWQFLQGIPELGPLIVNRSVHPQTLMPAVPEDRQPLVQMFFQKLQRYYLEPAYELLDKKAMAQAKKELPDLSDKDLRKIVGGEEISVKYDERIPKARVRQFQSDGRKTIDQVVKDAMLAGYKEMQEWQANNSPEIAQQELEERYEVTSTKYNPHFAYL